MCEPAIPIRGLVRRFGRMVEIVDLNLSIQPGVIAALAGPNGAGKKTLLSLLTGFTPQSRALRKSSATAHTPCLRAPPLLDLLPGNLSSAPFRSENLVVEQARGPGVQSQQASDATLDRPDYMTTLGPREIIPVAARAAADRPPARRSAGPLRRSAPSRPPSTAADRVRCDRIPTRAKYASRFP